MSQNDYASEESSGLYFLKDRNQIVIQQQHGITFFPEGPSGAVTERSPPCPAGARSRGGPCSRWQRMERCISTWDE